MMNTKNLKYVLIVFMFMCATGWATNYYVDATNGNDNNSGLSPIQAWKTINKINNSSFHSGDIIAFKRGDIFGGYTLTFSSQSRFKGVTFTDYGSGNMPIIDGGDTIKVANISNVDNLTFKNIEFIDGIRALDPFSANTCSYLTFDNCIFDGLGKSGRELLFVGTGAHNIIIKDCIFRNGGPEYHVGAHGLYFSGDTVLIEHCQFLDCWDGSGIKNDVDMVGGIQSSCTNITIRNNYFNGNLDGIFLESGDNVKIYNNIIINTRRFSSGITFTKDVGYLPYLVHNAQIYNNDIFLTPDSASQGILLYGFPEIDSITIKNNIFYSNTYYSGHMFIQQQAGGGPNLFISNNLYYTVGSTPDRWTIQGLVYSNFTKWLASGYEENCKWGDPLFNDLKAGDYTIKKGSPAINSGINVRIKTDYKGNKVPVYKPDIGALQHSYLEVNVKVLLEGPYKNGTMTNTLSVQNLIPKVQPYNSSPWKYNGTESVSSFSPNTVDWILIELRSTTDSVSTVAKRAALLRTDGTIVDLDGTSPVKFDFIPSDNYYIVIRHRNHLAIMSSRSVLLSDSTNLYDFSTSESQAYGLNAQASLGNGFYGMYGGDGDANGGVSSTDRNNVWRLENGIIGYLQGDYDLSGGANSTDLNSCWRTSNGNLSQVP